MVADLKVSLIGKLSPNLNVSFWRRPTGVINEFASRWLSVFEHHGVKPSQIPRLFPRFDLPLDKLGDHEKLLGLLNDDLCSATCERFNFERSWLDGDSDQIYWTADLDRSADTIVEVLVEVKLHCDDAEILAFRSSGAELEEDWSQFGALLIRSKLYDFREKSAYRYTPVFSLRHWGNPEQRYLAMRAIWAAHELGYRFRGGILSEDACIKIAEGRAFPEAVMTSQTPLDWHPDDYVHRPSAVAKGNRLLKQIIENGKQDGTADLVAKAKQRLSSQSDES